MIGSSASYGHESVPQINTHRTRKKIISAILQNWQQRFAPNWRPSTIGMAQQAITLKPIADPIFLLTQLFFI
ncbi:hypothetical protein EGT86_32005 [Burkholderia pseudomallei]|nr:hypothetical protein EGT86_32005 [Burkholderia pseudomallei]